MASRQSKRSLTFPLRPLDNTFSKSGGPILSGILIPSCCDDSFTGKPREQGELPTGAVLVKVDFFRVARHSPTNVPAERLFLETNCGDYECHGLRAKLFGHASSWIDSDNCSHRFYMRGDGTVSDQPSRVTPSHPGAWSIHWM